jgi:hypothetical protein
MLITSEEALVRRVTEQRERLLVFTDDVSESPVRAVRFRAAESRAPCARPRGSRPVPCETAA